MSFRKHFRRKVIPLSKQALWLKPQKLQGEPPSVACGARLARLRLSLLRLGFPIAVLAVCSRRCFAAFQIPLCPEIYALFLYIRKILNQKLPNMFPDRVVFFWSGFSLDFYCILFPPPPFLLPFLSPPLRWSGLRARLSRPTSATLCSSRRCSPRCRGAAKRMTAFDWRWVGRIWGEGVGVESVSTLNSGDLLLFFDHAVFSCTKKNICSFFCRFE